MKTTIKTVNKCGLEEIRSFLIENSRTPDLYMGNDPVTLGLLRAWAADAECQISEGNGACIELLAWDSIHGATQEFTISAAGIDVEEIEIDE